MYKYFSLLIIFFSISSMANNQYDTIKISKDVEIIKLSQHSYIHVSYTVVPGYGRISSNGYIYINNNEAILFDTPMTNELTKQLIDWITNSLKVKIIGYVPNHWHNDCMGGLSYLNILNVPSYANNLTITIAKNKNLPIPRYGFNDKLKLKIGNELVICRYYGPAHSVDNIVVWVPSEKVLFAGCMVKDLNSQNLGNLTDADILEWPKTIEKVILDCSSAKIVIPGHGEYGGTDLLIHTKELLNLKK